MKEFEFKGASVDSAIENGLKKLGLTKEEVEIEVVSEEGIFSKAVVKITPLNVDADVTIEETAEESEKHGRRRHGRRERIDYFTEEKEIGKETLKVIASYFTDKARIDAKSFPDEICFYIGGDDAKLFIGHRGETLDAIQCIISQIINKDRAEGEHVRVTLDADFYRERRKRTLTALAKKTATKSYEERREIHLEPMNSYERRIIHSALQNSTEATTRSEGEGKERHIVIVPTRELMTYGNVSSEFRKKGPGKTKSYGGKKIVF